MSSHFIFAPAEVVRKARRLYSDGKFREALSILEKNKFEFHIGDIARAEIPVTNKKNANSLISSIIQSRAQRRRYQKVKGL